MDSIHSASHGIFTIPALKSHFPEAIRELALDHTIRQLYV